MRGRLVDGDSLARDPSRLDYPETRTFAFSEIRRNEDPPGSGPDAGTKNQPARVALHRGSSYGRSDESSHVIRHRYLWEVIAEPERRADPPGDAMEIRIQGREVDRQYPVHNGDAEDRMDAGGPRRIWLLC